MENIDKNTIEEYSKYYNECFGESKSENNGIYAQSQRLGSIGIIGKHFTMNDFINTLKNDFDEIGRN